VVVVEVDVVVVGAVDGIAAAGSPVTFMGGLASGLEQPATPSATARATSAVVTDLGERTMAPLWPLADGPGNSAQGV
jgi:hypothetical protein